MPHVYDEHIDGPRNLWPTDRNSETSRWEAGTTRPVDSARPNSRIRDLYERCLPAAPLIFLVSALLKWFGAPVSAPVADPPSRGVQLVAQGSDASMVNGLSGEIIRGGPAYPKLKVIRCRLESCDREVMRGTRLDPPPGAIVDLTPGMRVQLLYDRGAEQFIEIWDPPFAHRTGWIARGYFLSLGSLDADRGIGIRHRADPVRVDRPPPESPRP